MIKRALISVSDKTGVVELAKALKGCGITIVSTGGTARLLKEKGIQVTSVSTVTGFPEILDGRVKTLHPAVFGGILFLRDDLEHKATIAMHGIEPIDLVVVNLYPFESTVAKGESVDECLEMIDIGGPSLIRAAAKNGRQAAVVVDPADYQEVIVQIEANGDLSPDFRLELMAKAFSRTAAYDAAIASYAAGLKMDGENTISSPVDFPGFFFLGGRRQSVLRYGENPHQKAALYRVEEAVGPSVVDSHLIQGKPLSYNNIVDLEAALGAVLDFEQPTAVVVKHTNPCGAGEAETIEEAFSLAWECDPMSAFGGILAFNREVSESLASKVVNNYVEAIIAPSFSAGSLKIMAEKPKVRLLAWGKTAGNRENHLDVRRVPGGFLVQESDRNPGIDLSESRVVTARKPTADEQAALAFSWRVVKHVKSNAVLFARRSQTLGIGAGQMSRVDAVKVAVMKAVLPLDGSVLASDAFFPFPDGLIVAAEAGATAIIQPGGSIRDEEVIKAADERGLTMIFTGRRHFRH